MNGNSFDTKEMTYKVYIETKNGELKPHKKYSVEEAQGDLVEIVIPVCSEYKDIVIPFEGNPFILIVNSLNDFTNNKVSVLHNGIELTKGVVFFSDLYPKIVISDWDEHAKNIRIALQITVLNTRISEALLWLYNSYRRSEQEIGSRIEESTRLQNQLDAVIDALNKESCK